MRKVVAERVARSDLCWIGMCILFVEEDANADACWVGTPRVAAITNDVEKLYFPSRQDERVWVTCTHKNSIEDQLLYLQFQ